LPAASGTSTSNPSITTHRLYQRLRRDELLTAERNFYSCRA
jgi:hypothetical protein